MEWKEVKILEIAHLKNGKKRPSNSGSFPVYGGNGIMDYVDSYNEDNVIIIGRVGAYCGCVYYCDSKCWISDNAISAKAKEDTDNVFLYYLLSNQKLNHHRIGGAQPLMTQDLIGRISVIVPEKKDDQRRIANILSSLDRKIELNNKINVQLEEMAQTLFKHWFVDFGPFKDGKFVESELGMIPEGWSVNSISELIKTTSGGTPSRKNIEYYEHGSIDWIKSKELNGGFIFDSEEKITDEAIKESSAKVLPQYSVLIAMYGATVGEYGIISKPMACNQAICALMPNSSLPYSYLFLFAKNYKDVLTNMAIGSAQQNISQLTIKNLKIAYNKKAFISFHNLIAGILRKISKMTEENLRLSALRDTLLPKLMSGEIELKELGNEMCN